MNALGAELPDIPPPDTYLGHWRKRNGWTFNYAAELLGLSENQYYIYEHELTPIPPIVIAASTGAILVHALQELHCKKSFFLRTRLGAGCIGPLSFITTNLKYGLVVETIEDDICIHLSKYLKGSTEKKPRIS